MIGSIEKSRMSILNGSAAIAFSAVADGAEQQVTLSFVNGQSCRSALSRTRRQLQVIVTPDVPDIKPINLAAALSHDDYNRDVYLIDDAPDGSLVRRARAANIRGIISYTQARELLSIEQLPKHLLETAEPLEPSVAQSEQPVPLEPTIAMTPPEPIATPPAALEPEHPEQVVAQPTEHPEQVVAQPAAQPTEQPEQLVAQPAEHPEQVVPFEDLLEPVEAAELVEVGCEAVQQMFNLAAVEAVSPSVAVTEPANDTAAQSAPAVVAQDPQLTSKDGGQILGFVSARGGVGKSALSLLSAVVAAKQGKRVVLIDFDLQFGDLGYLIGHEQGFAHCVLPMTDAAAAPQLCDIAPGTVVLLTAPQLPEDAERMLPQTESILRLAQSTADLVLVNTATLWDRLQITLAHACSHLIFVVDQRATSIQGCKQAIDLCVRMRIPQAKLAFMLNRCSASSSLSAQDVSLALGGVEVQQVMDGGQDIDELLALGCPDEALRASDALSKSLLVALGKILAVGGGNDFADWCTEQRPQKTAGFFGARKSRGWQ